MRGTVEESAVVVTLESANSLLSASISSSTNPSEEICGVTLRLIPTSNSSNASPPPVVPAPANSQIPGRDRHAHFSARCNERFAVIEGHDARTRHHARLSFGLQRTQAGIEAMGSINGAEEEVQGRSTGRQGRKVGNKRNPASAPAPGAPNPNPSGEIAAGRPACFRAGRVLITPLNAERAVNVFTGGDDIRFDQHLRRLHIDMADQFPDGLDIFLNIAKNDDIGGPVGNNRAAR